MVPQAAGMSGNLASCCLLLVAPFLAGDAIATASLPGTQAGVLRSELMAINTMGGIPELAVMRAMTYPVEIVLARSAP